MSYPQTQYGEYSGIRKKFKKVFKPVAKVVQKVTAKGPLKSVKKMLRKTTAAQVGFLTAGMVKPKFVGIKSKSGKKLFRIGGAVGKVVAVATLAVVAAPVVGPFLATAKTAVLGGMKFVGGKLVSAPMSVLSKLKSMGKTPATATPEEAVQAGIETGAVTPGMLEQLAGVIPGLIPALQGAPSAPPDYPEAALYPSRPTEEGVTPPEGRPVAEAGMFGGGMTPMLYLGAGFLALMMFGGKK